MKRTIIIAAVCCMVLGILLFGAAFALSGYDIIAMGESNVEFKTYTTKEGIGEIVISSYDMGIDIVASDGKEVVFEYYEDPELEPYVIDESNQRFSAVQKPKKWSIFSRSLFSGLGYIGKRNTLCVPRDFEGIIRIDTSNGSINVNGINADKLTLDTSNGSVTLSAVSSRSDITIDTSNGKVELSDVTSGQRLQAVSSNGKIEFSRITANDIVLETSNGKITGTVSGSVSDYKIHTRTSNGKNNLNNTQSGEKSLRAITSNGKIEIFFAD